GVDLWRGATLLMRGDLAEGLRLVAESRRQSRLWGLGFGAMSGGVHATALAWLGDLDEAERVLTEAGEPSRAGDDALHW
ncbi:hypothetical protein OFB63_36025, partial [Escherichia coli]|nr:hypothetical protein [Escherichia coli]